MAMVAPRVDAHLSDTDAFTLHLEADPLLRSTIVAVAMLDRPPDPDRLRARIERAVRLVPSFRSVLVPPRVALAPPRLVPDPHFDLDWHIRHIAAPQPADLRAVYELARRWGTAAFDPVRPLWDLHVVEGLPDGRTALVLKVHHALTDGVGGIRLAAHLVDGERDPGAEPPELPTAEVDLGPTGPLGEIVDGIAYRSRALCRTGATLIRNLPGFAARSVRNPMATAGELARDATSVGRFLAPVLTTRSGVMLRRGTHWRYDELDVPTDGLLAAAHMVGGGLNDAFLGGLTGGLARYHHRRSADARELTLAMPINLRGGSDDGVAGNKVTLARFVVPLHIDDPFERMMSLDRLTRSWREEPVMAWSQQVAWALNLLPRSVPGAMLHHVDVVASNVPGFPVPVYLAGAEVESFRAFGPPIGAAVNVTLLSYRGVCHLGITTDRAAVPDPELLLECLAEGFDEVVGLGEPLRVREGEPEADRIDGHMTDGNIAAGD